MQSIAGTGGRSHGRTVAFVKVSFALSQVVRALSRGVFMFRLPNGSRRRQSMTACAPNRRFVTCFIMFFALLCVGLRTASAQITTGSVTGVVRDAQGGVVPGATAVLISEARGTKSAPVVTDETGVYVLPNVTPDTYTLEVTMDNFKTVRRPGVVV